jgi:spore coat polysaccharide biosynthesis predicted glycosyltransferase SpsG
VAIAEQAMQTAIEAKELAKSAQVRILSHEELCAERYENIKASISDLKSIIKWAGTTMFGIIMLMLGWLAVQLYENNQARLNNLENPSVYETKGNQD